MSLTGAKHVYTEERERIVELYKGGKGLTEIANITGRSANTVARIAGHKRNRHTRSSFSDEDKVRLMQMRRDGASFSDIAAATGRAQSSVHSFIKAEGDPFPTLHRRPPLTAEQRDEVAELFKSGMLQARISEAMNITASQVSKCLHAMGLVTSANSRKVTRRTHRTPQLPEPEPEPEPEPQPPSWQDTSVRGLLAQLQLAMQREGVERVELEADGTFSMTQGGQL